MKLSTVLPSLITVAFLTTFSSAQQFVGDVIPNSLPTVPGSEITYFRVKDPAGKATGLTLTNYFSQNNGQRLDTSKVQRAVIIIHGLNRDPGTYMSNMLSALSQTTPKDSNVNFGTVQIMAPYFSNGNDKNVGYPWTNGLKPGRGSTSNALVWPGSQWSAGGNNQYPWNATTVSSYEVLDQFIKYFDDRTIYPNMKQIVVAGHSLGGQTVGRYAQIGTYFATKSPVTYWIGNPNSWAWLSTDRPLDTTACPTYDTWREGYTNFTQYPMTYAVDLVAKGRAAILANYMKKSKVYARGTLDLGDDSSSCAPGTTGVNRNERFFNFIKAFPPKCTSAAGQCDTVDYVKVGHDGGAMMASDAGQARLFLDNFYGDNKRAYDFGYPRKQAGDDPYPNPALNGTIIRDNTTYAGNMTFKGCYSDNTRNVRTLAYQAYDNAGNSIESCTSACAQQGYTIAGMEFGSQCFCANSLSPYATQTVDEGCNMACPGNSSQICGDGNRLSLYSNGEPDQAALPGTPEVVGNYNSLFCYTEASNGLRALSAKGYNDGTNMTLESCAAFCNGYQYFGVEYGSECYCGSYFNPGAVVTSDVDCSMTCTGNPRQYCGAGNRLTVYSLSDGASVSTITQPATSTVASSTASTGGATATASSIPTGSLCPAADGQIVAASGSSNYSVKCSSDSTVGAYQGVGATASYLDCMKLCDADTANKCQGFVYVGGTNGVGSGTCWLKNAVGDFSPSGSNFVAAWKVAALPTTTSTAGATPTPSVGVNCPANDTATYTASTGTTFLIECGVDHYGGDMGNVAVSSFAGCIEACATTKGCLDVSLVGNACYLKNVLGDGAKNSGVWGAKLVTVSVSSTTTASLVSPVDRAAVTPTSSSASASATDAPSFPAVSTTLASSSLTASSTISSSSAVSSSSSSLSSSVVSTSSVEPSSSTTSSSVLPTTTTTSIVSPVVNLPPSSSDSVTTTSSAQSSSSPASSSFPTTSTQAISSSSSSTSAAPTTTTPPPTTLSTTTRTTTSTTSTYSPSLPTGFTSLGCYTDTSSARSLPSLFLSNSTQTPSQCALFCRAAGYRYSGTEYASECWCGNSAPLVLAPTACAMPCAGDRTQVCGGGNKLSVVRDETWTPSFFAREKYGSWSSAGCYAEPVGGRALPLGVTPLNGGNANMTVANCLDACAARGLRYCGTEYYQECWGASVAPLPSLALAGDPLAKGCHFPCKGNATEACGGASRLLVYVNDGSATN